MDNKPFRGEENLESWLDRHHIDIIRTQATNLEGVGVGKYCHRRKFTKSLEDGLGISDMSLAMDLGGMPHLTFWHPFRHNTLGDIALKPDLNTLIPDGNDPNLGHCICDFIQVDGTPINLCPRTNLKRLVRDITDMGYEVKAACELEFYLFKDSFKDARCKKYQNLEAVGASKLRTIYYLRNAYHAKTFMDEVTQRLDCHGIDWEGWSDENGVGQVELNLTPTDAVAMADATVRAKQVIYEVAVDFDMSVTFMAHPVPGYSSGMHMHHSLTKNGEAVFYDADQPDNHSDLLRHWIGGMIKTMPGAVSYLCPTINSFKRMTEFAAPPLTATWGEENKSCALRLVSRSAGLTRVEHRLGAADVNPYLGLAVILAGGIAGVRHQITPPDEFTHVGWCPAREF
ncbi:MAG: glutamine synthetase [Proteobacteria bacterium]|nr:glutamine synthetase [Pseudomonadota bacterium]